MTLSFSPGSKWVPPFKKGNSKWVWESSYEKDKGIVEYKKEAGSGRGSKRVLAYYIPYSLDREKWGIYLVKDEIEKDINALKSMYNNDIIGHLYLSLVFLHELTHHVIEDLRTSKGGFNYTQEDESLCEYTAFTLTQAFMKKNSGTGIFLYLQWLSYLIPLVRLSMISMVLGTQMPENIVRATNTEYILIPTTEVKNGFITGFPVPGYIPIQWFKSFPISRPLSAGVKGSVIDEGLSEIYYYLSRDSDVTYSPSVPSWVNEDEFVKFLSQNLNVSIEDLWSDGLESVYDRVFIVLPRLEL